MRRRSMSRRSMSRERRGSLLVELVLLMSGGSAVLLTAILMMHRSFELTSQFQSISETQSAYARLSTDVRSDVYRAVAVHQDSERSVRFEHSDRVTTYEIATDEIIRTEKTAAGETRYQRYRIPRDARVEWNLESPKSTAQADEPRRIGLQVRRPVAPQLSELRLELSIGACMSATVMHSLPSQVEGADEDPPSPAQPIARQP